MQTRIKRNPFGEQINKDKDGYALSSLFKLVIYVPVNGLCDIVDYCICFRNWTLLYGRLVSYIPPIGLCDMDDLLYVFQELDNVMWLIISTSFSYWNLWYNQLVTHVSVTQSCGMVDYCYTLHVSIIQLWLISSTHISVV